MKYAVGDLVSYPNHGLYLVVSHDVEPDFYARDGTVLVYKVLRHGRISSYLIESVDASNDSKLSSADFEERES